MPLWASGISNINWAEIFTQGWKDSYSHLTHFCADMNLLAHSKTVTLTREFLSQNCLFHKDSSTTCLSGKPQGLLAATFGRGPDWMGHAKTHPWTLPWGPCEPAAQTSGVANGQHLCSLLLLKCWLQEGNKRGCVRLQWQGLGFTFFTGESWKELCFSLVPHFPQPGHAEEATLFPTRSGRQA